MIGVEIHVAYRIEMLADVLNGSIASFWPYAGDFRSTPNNGHHQAGRVGPFRANMPTWQNKRGGQLRRPLQVTQNFAGCRCNNNFKLGVQRFDDFPAFRRDFDDILSVDIHLHQVQHLDLAVVIGAEVVTLCLQIAS